MRPSILRSFGLTQRLRSAASAEAHEPLASTSSSAPATYEAPPELKAGGRDSTTPERYVRALLRRYGPMPIHQLFAATRAAPIESKAQKARFAGAPTHIIQSVRHLKKVLRGLEGSQSVNEITRRKLRDWSDRAGVPDGTDRIDELNLAAVKGRSDYVWLDGESFRRLSILRHQLGGGSDALSHKAWREAPKPLVAPTLDPMQPPPSPWDFEDEAAAEFFAQAAPPERDDAALFAQDPQLRRTIVGNQTVSQLKAEARLAAKTARRRAKAMRTLPLPDEATATDRYAGEERPATAAEIRRRAQRSLHGARQLPPAVRRACVSSAV